MPDLNVTLIQTELSWENVDANLAMFAHKIAGIKESTDLILLPEMFSTGFSMNAEKLGEDMKGKAIQWMKEQAKAKGAIICGSLIIKENGKYYNRLIWMRPDTSYSVYDKRHLFRMGEENNHYSGGKSKIIEEIKGWKILPLVCYDLRFPVWSRNQDNYDVLLYVANWPERRNHAWKSLLLARAIENQAYVLGLNRVGNDGNNIYYSGDSAVINFKGEVLYQEANKGFVKTFALKKQPLEDYRKEFPVLMDKDEFELK